MRIFTLSIKSLALLLLISVPLSGQNAQKPWTFLVYMAADNNLNPDADLNISQMQKSSTNENVNILVYLNIKRKGQKKQTQKLVIHNGVITQEGPTTVEDSGSEQTLIKALNWAILEYPSDHLAVDLWDHGSGALNRSMIEHRGVCYDDTTGNYLTDRKYQAALNYAVNSLRHGAKIDVITFDACLMAMIEVGYTLQDYANYMVASQETVPGEGFNYETVLAPFAKGSLDPASFAKWLVSSYDDNYKSSGESYTLSAYDLNKLTAVINSTNKIADLSNSLIKQNLRQVAVAIKRSAAAPLCPHFTEPTYIDLYIFYLNLSNYLNRITLNNSALAQVKTELKAVLGSLPSCIIANAHSKDLLKARGMSIYFPDLSYGIEPSYPELYWTEKNPQWAGLIQTIANS
jgi:hypothetical protein